MKELLNTLKPLNMSLTESEYSRFIMLVSSIDSQFKFSCIDFDKRIELRDYILPSLNYINKHLILVKADDILDKIDGFVDIVEHINDAIIEKNCNVICKDLEYSREEFDLIYFTYLWTSLTTNMLVRLKYNYGWRRKKPSESIQGCGCPCTDCPCKDTCPCCCNKDNNKILDYRPIQESYYTKWDTNDSYLERF
jgi:hypothetical protein